jgi:hypothetical protein
VRSDVSMASETDVASSLSASGGAVSSDYWVIEIKGTQIPASLTNAGTPSIADLKFMTSAGAGANAGSGALVTPSSTWSNASNVFDGNATSFGFSSNPNPKIGFQFDAPQTITHLSITTRNDAFWWQAPKSINLYYSTDGGTTLTLYRHMPIEAAWSQGETKIVPIWGGYASEDLSALDEAGGYRFYAIKNTGLSFAGATTCFVPELLLKASGLKIEYQAHRQRFSGMSVVTDAPADGSPEIGYTQMSQNSYLILDFGYKRVIEEFGYTARTTFNTQAPTKLELYGLTGAMANDASWTLAEMTLLKSVDDSASSPPASGADRTFSYP